MDGFISPISIGPAFVLIFLWELFWKGIALWRASKLGQRNWFIAILVISSLGILEIVYLFKFAEKPLTIKEFKSWFSQILENKEKTKKS